MGKKSNLGDEFKKLRDDLRTLADEIRVKVHLGSMDAKDAWKELEPKIHDFEGKAKKVTDEIGVELKHFGATLKDELHRIRERLES